MRLVCPNCGAKYEIDAALLPEAGRDVQCSACGHTWFQRRDTLEADLADEMGVTAPEAEPTHPPRPEPASPLAAESVQADPEPEEEDEAPLAPPPRTRRPDEAALAILREEAEREAAARRREAAGLETQTEMGLSGAADAVTATTGAALGTDAGEEVPDFPGEQSETQPQARQEPQPEAQPEPDSSQDSRSDVFPDIEEINSSLSAAESEAMARRAAEEKEEGERSARRGFRVGFLTVVTFIAALIVLYAFAPRLAESFPQARPALSDYVDWVNRIRIGLEGLMQAAADRIKHG